jgi:uncharacterized protein
LYGGEPLLCGDKVLFFLKAIFAICNRRGLRLYSTLVTNGYHADVATIGTLAMTGLSVVHYTLDGPSATHDQRRPLHGGGETFATVFSNMIAVMNAFPQLEIECRVNFDRSNLVAVPKLLDLVAENDLDRRISLYFNYVNQTVTQVKSGCSFCSCNALIDDREIADGLLFLYREARQRGYPILDFYSKGPCMTVARDACLIDPQGDIYKCVDMIGCESMCMGSVYNDDYNPLYYTFMNASAVHTCFHTDCPFVPLCAGGCAMEPFIADGNPFQVACHRQMFELIHNGLLPLRFA